MERRFMIREFPSGGAKYNNVITEYELNRRIDMVVRALRAGFCPYEKVINILLHGDGGNGEEV